MQFKEQGRPLALEARNVSLSFKGFYALQKVSVQVVRGSRHALVGPNGAGKTTLFNCLTRFLDVSEGSIFLDGSDITDAPAHSLAARGLVRSFQISSVFETLTALENVRLALQKRNGINNRLWVSKSLRMEMEDEAHELLNSVGLRHLAGMLAGQLSYGRKRALELATTLALNPKILLLDEPMAGLGREDIAQTTDLILKATEGRTLVMVEHNLSVVQKVSDTVTVLARGQKICEGTYEQVASDSEVQRAYVGDALV